MVDGETSRGRDLDAPYLFADLRRLMCDTRGRPRSGTRKQRVHRMVDEGLGGLDVVAQVHVSVGFRDDPEG
jgi:hypothetical protein